MVISVSIGSGGEGAPSYSVRLPFTLSPNRTLKLADGGHFELLGQACEITQERDQYVLTIYGFDSDDAAATFLMKASAGLIWFGLKKSVGCKFDPDPTSTELFTQPKPVVEGSMIAPMAGKKEWSEIDGHYDADRTIIRPEHKRLIVFGAGPVTVRLDTPISILSEAMLEGMAEGKPELVLRDPKLPLACEVYLSSHFESTTAASFLSRITALEILIADDLVTKPVRQMVEEFLGQAKAAQKTETDAAVQREFASLTSGLSRLRYRSIKTQIRSLIEETLRADPDFAEPAKASREISQLYDLRSNLVHNGDVDKAAIGEGNNRLNEVVPRVLRALFQQTAQRGE